jgi:hypothetical protein
MPFSLYKRLDLEKCNQGKVTFNVNDKEYTVYFSQED